MNRWQWRYNLQNKMLHFYYYSPEIFKKKEYRQFFVFPPKITKTSQNGRCVESLVSDISSEKHLDAQKRKHWEKMWTWNGKPKSPRSKANYFDRKMDGLSLGSDRDEHDMTHMRFYTLAKQTENQAKCSFPCWMWKMLGKNILERKL